MRFEVTTEGNALEVTLGWQAALSDLRKPLERYCDQERRWVMDQFTQSQDPYGDNWAPLTRATIEARARRGTGNQPLQDTKRMMSSFEAVVAGGNEIRVAFKDFKAALHDAGAGRLPKRQLMPDAERGLPAERAEALKLEIINHLRLL